MASDLQQAFEDFVRDDAFPCVGAKSVLARSAITFFEAPSIDAPTDDFPLYQALKAFGVALEETPGVLKSLVAVFAAPTELSELAFDRALWGRLQALHNMDAASGRAWTDAASSDPNSPHFSMSVAGHAFFVVGLHPNASRTARRFSHPALVFNSRAQFQALREQGRFGKMQSVIRKRDTALDGDINPMLDDYGNAPETRQYSGRLLPEQWTCPLVVRTPAE